MTYHSIPQQQLQLKTIEGKPADKTLRIKSCQGYFFLGKKKQKKQKTGILQL